MYYIANVVLLESGYKVGDKISHKVTADSWIVFVRGKLKKQLLEEYENVKENAMELISAKVDSRANELLELFDVEREKRSKFQYNMSEEAKKSKAVTSFNRAKEFIFEMKKGL